MNRYYIGLAATMHDPAIAIVGPDGKILFAEASERYLQCKRAWNCTPDEQIRAPELIAEYCPPDAEIVASVSWSTPFLASLDQISRVRPNRTPPSEEVQEPDAEAEMLAELHWFPMPPAVLRNSISQATLNLTSSKAIANKVSVRRYNHHLCHAALSAFTSPFEECAVAIVDALGEGVATGLFHYQDGRVTILPDSVGSTAHPGLADLVSMGFYYARLCVLCGFDFMKGEEWKVMGLAPYGRHDPELYRLFRSLIAVDGLQLVQGCSISEYVDCMRQLRSMSRSPGSSPMEAADMAYAGQKVFEDIMGELLSNLHSACPSKNLAIGGGCALNSAWNGKITEETPFENLYVPSAPGDDGNAVGAALLAYYEDHPQAKPEPGFVEPYLGTRMAPRALELFEKHHGLRNVTKDCPDLYQRVAKHLADGKIIGWVKGRAEFGPRALGNRSILADPRGPEIKGKINSRVKFREAFRPFAPAILDEAGPEYFEHYEPTPYMERALRFRPEKAELLPAVAHVNRTGRLQSVRREWNPEYYDLIKAFYELTGVPILLNTSYNVMGKPIMHSVQDALSVFMTAGLDVLVLENFLIEK